MKKSPIHVFTSALGLIALMLLTSACTKGGSSNLDQPISSQIAKDLKSSSAASLQIKETPLFTSIQAIDGPNPATPPKVGVLYVGADFCPYCAALRWPLIVALQHFGTFSGLETMRSSPTDVYPDTTTFTFIKAHYSSPYVKFIAVETADRHGKPLQPLKGQAAELFRKYDAPPYTTQAGGIPFLYIGGRWLLLGSPVNPKEMGQRPWAELATELAKPNSKLAKAVLPQANLITAAICQQTGGKPEKVCKAPAIVAASKLLPPR